MSCATKNAADKKLKSLLHRFINVHGARSRIILISGDGDFANDLFTLKSQGWKFLSCSHCQELCQQGSWLLIG